ncbi:YlbF family regulator [Bacillus tianshenii]|nr:YlbF family regulator [Bacillus tianshenii]
MANLYDVAYDLEKAIRESEDFKQLKQVYEEVNNDESSRKMFENFRDLQLELQRKQMQGEQITEEEVQKAQQSVQLVQQHEKISKLMEMEQRMSMVVNDLNKIIMKPLEEMYGTPDENQQ